MKLKYTEAEWNALSAEEQNAVMDKLTAKSQKLIDELNELTEEMDRANAELDSLKRK
jgi:predicted Fe-S protein YdhL (DUF1289 family)